MGHFRPLFYFCLFYCTICRLNFADVWIWTAALWCQKGPLFQLSHNHCPCWLFYLSQWDDWFDIWFDSSCCYAVMYYHRTVISKTSRHKCCSAFLRLSSRTHWRAPSRPALPSTPWSSTTAGCRTQLKLNIAPTDTGNARIRWVFPVQGYEGAGKGIQPLKAL